MNGQRDTLVEDIMHVTAVPVSCNSLRTILLMMTKTINYVMQYLKSVNQYLISNKHKNKLIKNYN